MSIAKFTDHPNSHVITIFRSGSYLHRAQGAAGKEYVEMGNMSVGSYFRSPDIPIVESGLTETEEDLLTPQFIDCNPDEREYRKLRTDFYASMDTKVPATGVNLQIGLTEDNTKPVSKTNKPLVPMDYIRWKHALKHPEVGESKEIAESRARIKYYIFDPMSVQTKKSKSNLERDAAMKIYYQIQNDAEKVDGMLTLMGVDIRTFTGKKEKIELDKEDQLRELAEKKPVDFVDQYSNKDFETRSLVQKMINCKVLERVGPKILDADSRAVIGNSMEEVYLFFQDDTTNSEAIVVYKARLQEYSKRPIPKEARRTVVPNK